MSDTSPSFRQIKLLGVVAEGGGDWDAQRIDMTADARYGPGEGTVLQELEHSRCWDWLSETTADPASAADGR
jgi:hypothetical protein